MTTSLVPPPPPLPKAVPRAIELVWVRLPLLEPFVSSHGVEHDRQVVLVQAIGDGDAPGDVANGWGECSALNEPTYTSEHTAGAWDVLRDRLAPAALQGGRARSAATDDLITDALTAGLAIANPMAATAVEVACVDLALRRTGASLADELGRARDTVRSGVVVGIPASIDALLAMVASRLEAGYRQVKLKIRPGWDVEPLRAVRRCWPDLVLAADANGSFDLAGLVDLAEGLDDLDLAYVEQPLPAPGVTDTVELVRRLSTPVALDESIVDVATADEALDRVPGVVVNLKPARVGGLDASRALLASMAARSASAFVGGMLETGVGRAVALAVASTPPCTAVSDLGPSDRYFEHDITESFVLHGGCLAVPNGPGIGVTVDQDRLDDVAVRRLMIEG